MSIRKAEDLFIIDVDVHMHTPPAQIAPYCEMPWRRALENLTQNFSGIATPPPGYAPYLVVDAPFPDDGMFDRADLSPQQMRAELDALHIDVGVLCPDHLLTISMLPDAEYASAICRAYNRLMLDFWLGHEYGLKGLLVLPPQRPEDGIKEIEKYAKEPNVIGICFPTVAVDPLYGNERFFDLYAAAEDAQLPILFHSAESIAPAFPFNLHRYETSLARHTISHPFSLMANLISLINTGVPVRFPKLKFAFLEGGVSWVPFIMHRLDKEYLSRRREVPFLEQPPSAYIKNFFYATQPIEEPEPLSDLIKIFDLYGGETNTMFASDWPHYDFDHPNKILQVPFSDEVKRKIMSENALRFFNRTQAQMWEK